MEASSSLTEEHLLCPLCCEVFSYPVALKCGHNSCKACLRSHWEWKGARECPVCRRTENTQRPPINLALKIASDNFKQQAEQQKASEKLEELCNFHNEKLKLFCRTDGKPICLVCQTSREHYHHTFCPVVEAASYRKKDLSTRYNSLKKQLNTLEKVKDDWGEMEIYIQRQADQTETLIKEEFEKLHRFLWDEEAARLTVLQEEKAKKTEVVKEKLEDITKKVEDLSEIIRDIEVAMNAEDIPFLKGYKETISRAQYTMQEPESLSGVLIDAAQYLTLLKFSVWKKMVGIIQNCPVTLDPNTAQPNLTLADEFTSVQYGKKQELPNNPERCSSRMSVLASAGFLSGKHSWIVDMGSSREWYIGVARESIRRKTTVFLNPAEGFWVIGLCNGDTYWAQTSPRTRLVVKRNPQRITVELDYGKGKVTFLSDDGTVIYTFRHKFTDRIFPYFAPGIYEEGESPLKICPLNVSIIVY